MIAPGREVNSNEAEAIGHDMCARERELYANSRKTGGFLLPLTKLSLLKSCHIHTPVSKQLKSSSKAGWKATGFVYKYVDGLQLTI